MNFDRYTDRSKGFVQSGQSLALREGHQQFTAEHLLKVLLDDEEGLASGLIERAGGRPRDALAGVEQTLEKRPKVSGGSGQTYVAQEMHAFLTPLKRLPTRLATSSSPPSGCCWHSSWKRAPRPAAFSPMLA